MSTSTPTSRPALWSLLAVTLLVLASIGLHVYLLGLNRESNAELATRFVSVEDYNNLVRAQNKLTTLITNQQTLFGEHRTELARLAGQFDRLDGACVKSGSLAELYVKMSEYEERLRERMAAVDILQAQMGTLVQGTNKVDRLQAEVEGLIKITNKVDALQRALIKLSLGFQDMQSAGKPAE
jgi:hypothetical protein